MKSCKKYIEKLKTQANKNPGKANKEKREAIRKAERGQLMPAPKVIRSKKDKNLSRASLKKALRDERY